MPRPHSAESADAFVWPGRRLLGKLLWRSARLHVISQRTMGGSR